MDITALLGSLPRPVIDLLVIGLLYLLNNFIQDRRKKSDKESDAIDQLKLAVVELKVEVKGLRETLQDLPKIKRDVDAAHEKIRDLSV
jgi:hypothetical protein